MATSTAVAAAKDKLPSVGQAFKPSTANGNVAKTGLGSEETLAAPESVESRMKGIVSDTSSSGLMQKARADGEKFAARRGLLNSAMAGQASQAAVYDKALPIAAQDAASSVSFSRADQDFGFAERQNLEQIQSQETMQKRALSAQAALQAANLKAQQAMQKAQLGQQLTLADKQILANRDAAQRAFENSQVLLSKEYAERGVLQAADLEGRAKIERDSQERTNKFQMNLQRMQNQHQVFLTQAQQDFARTIQRSQGAQSIVEAYSREFEAIVNNPNFDAATRQRLIDDAQARTSQRMTLQNALLGFPTGVGPMRPGSNAAPTYPDRPKPGPSNPPPKTPRTTTKPEPESAAVVPPPARVGLSQAQKDVLDRRAQLRRNG